MRIYFSIILFQKVDILKTLKVYIMFSPSNSSESYLGLPYNLRWSSLLQALTVVTKRLILDFEKTELPTNQPTNQLLPRTPILQDLADAGPIICIFYMTWPLNMYLNLFLQFMSFCQDTVLASELKYSLESFLTCLVLLPEAALKKCSYKKVFSKSSMQEVCRRAPMSICE